MWFLVSLKNGRVPKATIGLLVYHHQIPFVYAPFYSLFSSFITGHFFVLHFLFCTLNHLSFISGSSRLSYPFRYFIKPPFDYVMNFLLMLLLLLFLEICFLPFFILTCNKHRVPFIV